MQIFSYTPDDIMAIFKKVCIALNLNESNLLTFVIY